MFSHAHMIFFQLMVFPKEDLILFKNTVIFVTIPIGHQKSVVHRVQFFGPIGRNENSIMQSGYGEKI